MVRSVPRRRDSRDAPPVDFDSLAVLEHTRWRILPIERRVRPWADGLQRERRATDDRRARPLRQRCGGGTVVAVGVRAHDRNNLAAADRRFERVEVFRQVRPRIDDRDLARADEVGLGAVISEGGRIVCEDAGNALLHLFKPGIRRVHARGLATSEASLASAQAGTAAAAGAVRTCWARRAKAAG